MTIQQFYRVNGDSTQNRGVLSDIVLPSLSEYLSTPEKDMDFALAFDKVKPVDHKATGMVTPALIDALKARSAVRVGAEKEFIKLAKDIERLKTLRDRKRVSLNEVELKAEMSKEEVDDADPEKTLEPKDKEDKGVYKLHRDFVTTEILRIMEDLIQGKKLAPAQGR